MTVGVRLQVLSDLHADVARVEPPPRLAAGVDAVVVAGDVAAGGDRSIAYLRRRLGRDVPIVMVMANHEPYGSSVERCVADLRASAARHGVTFLEDDVADVAGLRLAGCTLWTDYAVYGDARAAMRVASVFMNDHRRIAGLTPAAARDRHRASCQFLWRTRCDVVLTNHLPSPRSVAPRFAGDPLTPAFASDLEDLVAAMASTLWVLHHTHTSCDYRLGATRVVCNPHGYGAENPDYDPALVIEVGA